MNGWRRRRPSALDARRLSVWRSHLLIDGREWACVVVVHLGDSGAPVTSARPPAFARRRPPPPPPPPIVGIGAACLSAAVGDLKELTVSVCLALSPAIIASGRISGVEGVTIAALQPSCSRAVFAAPDGDGRRCCCRPPSTPKGPCRPAAV